MSSEHGPALLSVIHPDENGPVSGPQVHDAARGGRGVVPVHATVVYRPDVEPVGAP